MLKKRKEVGVSFPPGHFDQAGYLRQNYGKYNHIGRCHGERTV